MIRVFSLLIDFYELDKTAIAVGCNGVDKDKSVNKKEKRKIISYRLLKVAGVLMGVCIIKLLILLQRKYACCLWKANG